MSKGKFYKIATWTLLVLNLGVLGFFLFLAPRPPHPRKAAFRGRATEILHLDKDQEAKFIELAEAHNQKMKALKKEQADLLKSYFQAVTKEVSNEEQQMIMDEVLEMEKSKVEVTFSHFQDVKSMLKPDQKEYFQTFMDQALGILLLDGKGKRPLPAKAK